ncbi:MAG: VWA domain-containing protein [Pelotomaculum sp.]|nr:VWA domain-containing protein [Pelotomaculum sp.]
MGPRRWPPTPKNMRTDATAPAGPYSPCGAEEGLNSLLYGLAEFVHILRRLGVRVSVAETRDAYEALSWIDLLDREQVRAALSVTLVKNRHDREVFDLAFDAYFVPPEVRQQRQELRLKMPACEDGRAGGGGDELVKAIKEDVRDWGRELLELNRQAVEKNEKLSIKPGWTKQFRKQLIETIGRMEGGAGGVHPALIARTVEDSVGEWRGREVRQAARRGPAPPLNTPDAPAGAAVPDEALPPASGTGRGDLSIIYSDMKKIDDEDLPRAALLIKKLSRRMATRISRRYFRSRRRGRLDLRRTIRKNISLGGTLMELKFQSKKKQKPRVVLICDVSGSMARYTIFVIQFIYGLLKVVRGIETFIFSEDLERITPYLKKGEGFARTMYGLVEQSAQWGMGTNLHASLAAFLDKHRRLLSPAVYVIIVSDAQTIQARQAAEDLEEIRGRVRDVIWLNTMPREEWKRSPATLEFQRHCRMFECSTLDQLNKVLGSQMFIA